MKITWKIIFIVLFAGFISPVRSQLKISYPGKFYKNREYHYVVRADKYYVHLPYYEPAQSKSTPNDKFYYFNTRSGNIGLMDSLKRIIIPAEYDSISDDRGCWFVHRKSGHNWIMLSEDGSRILNDSLPVLPKDLGAFYTSALNGKQAILAKNGHFISGYIYDAIDTTPYNLYVLKINGKYRLINEKLENVQPGNLDDISTFVQGYCVGRINGKTGLLDSTGHWAIPPDQREIYNSDKNLQDYFKIKEIPGSEKRGLSEDSGIRFTVHNYESIFKSGWVSLNYQLIDNCKDQTLKRLINNYIISSNELKFHYRSDFRDWHHRIPVAADLEQWAFPFGDSWPDEHYPKNITIKCLSDNFFAICCKKAWGLSGSSDDHGNLRLDTFTDYLYYNDDSLQHLEEKDLFNVSSWKDSIVKYYFELLPDSTTQRISDPRYYQYLMTRFRQDLPHSDFYLNENGLGWNLYTGEKQPVVISYRRLKSILKKDGPFSLYYQ